MSFNRLAAIAASKNQPTAPALKYTVDGAMFQEAHMSEKKDNEGLYLSLINQLHAGEITRKFAELLWSER
jgi:hypothetical protein